MTTFPLPANDLVTPDSAASEDISAIHAVQVIVSHHSEIDEAAAEDHFADRRYRSGSYLGDRLLQLASDGPLFSEPSPVGPTEHDGVAAAFPNQRANSIDNRRTFPRRSSECLVAIHRCGRDAPVRWVEKDWLLHSAKTQGTLRDISLSGVAFSATARFESDDVLMLRIANPQLGTSVDVAGRVVRVTHESEQLYVVMLRLEKQLTLEEISPLRLQFSSDAVVW